ncbi:MAG: class F420-dependent oxidoreductase [Mycobacterium sp.]|nr:class F420-dependent oxidoreductase [Mycobacterium sp.]
MTTGITIRPDPAAANAVDDAVSQAFEASRRGVRQVWFSQRFDVDVLTLAAVVAGAVPGLGVGTAIVPINPRHPLLVASAAQTAQAAAHGHFSLGIGLGGNALEQSAFGIPAGNEIARLREYLSVLRTIREGGDVDFHGQELTARPPLSPVVPGGVPFPIYVAAMGPRALRVAGELADGTLTYLAGPRAIEEFIAPTITQAAADAGQLPPRIIASVPVAVTANPDAARAEAMTSLRFYDQFPSYQKILAREGVTSAADLAVIGDSDAVIGQLLRYRAAGATDLVLNPFQTTPSDLHELWAVAAEL